MAEGGYRSKAGQSVRLLDVPTTRTYGELHGHTDGSAFSDTLRRAAATHYGHAGRAFLEKLTRDQSDFCALLEKVKGDSRFTADEGQEKRAAGRFALVALAGELATECGITGWPKRVALNAATECFAAWRSLRGPGNDERRQILEQVSDFIQRYGDGRFSHKDSTSEIQPRDRAGWWEDQGDLRLCLFTSPGLHEALKGHDFKRALDVLQEAGALPSPGADGKRARPHRLGGRVLKVYPIKSDQLEGGHVA